MYQFYLQSTVCLISFYFSPWNCPLQSKLPPSLTCINWNCSPRHLHSSLPSILYTAGRVTLNYKFNHVFPVENLSMASHDQTPWLSSHTAPSPSTSARLPSHHTLHSGHSTIHSLEHHAPSMRPPHLQAFHVLLPVPRTRFLPLQLATLHVPGPRHLPPGSFPWPLTLSPSFPQKGLCAPAVSSHCTLPSLS